MEPIDNPLSPHDRWMSAALDQARTAFNEGEVPVGAVVVMGDAVIGRGHNMVERLNDATAHAEIIAIGAASQTAGSWRLGEAALYTTLEPCVMCAGAVDACRLGRLIYATGDTRKGAFGSVVNMLEVRGFSPGLSVDYGLMVDESSALLKAFFEAKRSRDKIGEGLRTAR